MQPSDVSVEHIRHALTPLVGRTDIRLIILFGSVAAGVAGRDSDIDLGILASAPFDVTAMTQEIAGYLGTARIDVVDLRRASPLLAMQALRAGRLLYEAHPGDYAAYYSLALRRYVDTAKLRAAQQAVIADFLAARGLA
jgi:uncharacterized protein